MRKDPAKSRFESQPSGYIGPMLGDFPNWVFFSEGILLVEGETVKDYLGLAGAPHDRSEF